VQSFLAWLEGTSMAAAVGQSLMLSAALSAVHVLGVTLVGGAALLSGLRLSGALFAERPLEEIVRPAGRVLFLGLSIALATGVLQVLPRALMAAGNSTFRLKMSMLLVAAACQLTLYRRVAPAASAASAVHGSTRAIGLAASVLWIGVVAAGAAFILLE
jgi:hypothetical protein